LALGNKGVGSKAGNEEVAEGTEGGSTLQAGDDAQYRDLAVSGDHIDSTVSVGSSASMSRNDLDIEQSIRALLDSMATWTLAYLVSNAPTSSTSAPPPRIATIIQPPRKAYIGFLAKTLPEQAILAVLHASEKREEAPHCHVLHIQAANILNELCCARLQKQLACKEKKSGGKGRLMGDGLPCLLSGDEFYEKVVEHEAAQRCKERKLEARKKQCEEMAEAITEWKKAETKRKEENMEWHERFQEAVKVWEKMREEAAVKAVRPRDSSTAYPSQPWPRFLRLSRDPNQ
jgi:hypothetical protein